MTSVAIAAAAARPRPGASGRFETTSATSAGYDSCAAAAIKASMLEPRPEMRIATRFLAIAGWYVGFLGRATLAASITAPLAPTLSPQAGRGQKRPAWQGPPAGLSGPVREGRKA